MNRNFIPTQAVTMDFCLPALTSVVAISMIQHYQPTIDWKWTMAGGTYLYSGCLICYLIRRILLTTALQDEFTAHQPYDHFPAPRVINRLVPLPFIWVIISTHEFSVGDHEAGRRNMEIHNTGAGTGLRAAWLNTHAGVMTLFNLFLFSLVISQQQVYRFTRPWGHSQYDFWTFSPTYRSFQGKYVLFSLAIAPSVQRSSPKWQGTSPLALSYQEDPGHEKQAAHAVTQDSVVGDVTTAENAVFREGGTRAWMAVIGVFLVQFSTIGYTNAYGVYNDYYIREYLANKSTSAQISWIGSVQLWIVLSVGLFSGRAFDAGYFYHLMIGGFILFQFCLFMISVSKPEQYYQVFLAQGFGMGIAIGIMYIPALGILSHYFQKRRALAMGLATSGAAFGGAIHPIMLNAWFHGALGFHSGVRASAGLTGGSMIIALFLMKPRYPANKNKASSTLRYFRVFLQDLPYVTMILGTSLTLAGLYYPIFFLQLNAIKNGMDPHLAFYTIAILNGASVLGRVMPNLLVYRLGPFNVIIPCVLFTSVLVFCTLAIKDVAGTIIFAILYGFFSGSYISIMAPMVGSTADTDSEIGARFGVCFTFTGFGGLLGTPIIGALLSHSFLWWRPTLFSGMSILGGSLCFFTARCLFSRRKKTPWL